MKSLSRTAVLFICILLTVVMTAANILYCLHSTLMSSSHFSKLLEEDQKLNELTHILKSSLDASEQKNAEAIPQGKYAAKILAATEEAWVKSQVFILSKAIHQYIFEAATTLPTLDIIPLQKSIRTVLVSDIMQSDEAKLKTAKVESILSVLNNKYFARVIDLGVNSQLVSMLLELSPVKATGFDRASVQEIVKIYLSLSNQNISLKEASFSITEQLTADALRLNQVKDYFDCNAFMEKSFGEHNPLKMMKVYLSSTDRTLTWTTRILFLCLLALLCFLKKFKIVKIAKLTAICLLSSSILTLITAFLMINNALVEALLALMYPNTGVIANIITKLASLLIKDAGYYLALQAALMITLCIAALFFLAKLNKKSKIKKVSRRFPVLRIAFAILAFTFIFFTWSMIAVSNQYHTLMMGFSELSNSELSQSVMQGLIDVGGMEFLNFLK